MSSGGEKKKTIVRTSDGQTIEVAEAVARQFETLNQMDGDDDGDSVFPLHNVNSKILEKVIEYCNNDADADENSSDDSSYKADLKKELKDDHDTLFDLILAANYLNVKSLFDFTCQIVADMMKGKSPEDIRKIFHIKNDYTKEEEEEVRRENQWAFE